MSACPALKLIFVINSTDKTAVSRMITRARRYYGHEAVIFLGANDMFSLGDVDRPPVRTHIMKQGDRDWS